MFFTTISEFLKDIQTIFANQDLEINSSTSDDPNIVSLGTTKQEKKEATVRSAAQIILTLFVIGLCLFAVATQSGGIGEKLAFTGFGIVFGYWFR